MKKQLVVALGLTVLATPAFASKARLQALGEDTNGSFYINDNRNIFLNAAHVNNHKDLVTFETGSETSDTDVDSSSDPRPEGGVFFGQGNLVYGVQLGNESATSDTLRAWAGVGSEQNNLDLFVGGDAGVKWGANFTYGHVSETADVNSSDVMRTRLGVVAGDIEGFANISLKNTASDKNGNEVEGKLGYQVGGSYAMNAYKFFAEYRSIKAEDKKQNADAEIGLMRIGAGRTDKLNDKATLFTKVEYSRNKGNIETGSGAIGGGTFYNGVPLSTQGEDLIVTNLPIIIGLEYDAASWLAVRGSVSQSIFSDVSIKGSSNENLANTTAVNLGSTLKFGEMAIDGVIGNGEIPTDAGTNGSLRTDNLMSRVSVSYKW
jgi:hypothetical protein